VKTAVVALIVEKPMANEAILPTELGQASLLVLADVAWGRDESGAVR
jgi:hypothetical protein